ncbi:hypothetical protein LZ31DRAFT_268262 [Colletotrichum somersetense]|nr:hypothetical protein LZ31DRAFT_268262 [Colletotrichum somersetense]
MPRPILPKASQIPLATLKPLELKRGGIKTKQWYAQTWQCLSNPRSPRPSIHPRNGNRPSIIATPKRADLKRVHIVGLKAKKLPSVVLCYENGIRSGLLAMSPHLGYCHWQHHGATQNATTSNTRPQDGITTREFPAHYFSPLLHDMFGRTTPHRGSLTANTARGLSYWALPGTHKSTAMAETAKLAESNIARHPYRVAPSYHFCSRAVWRVTFPPRSCDEE